MGKKQLFNLHCDIRLRNEDEKEFRLVRQLHNDPIMKVFMYLLYALFTNNAAVYLYDITNTNRTYNHGTMLVSAGVGNGSYGIVVGTGTAAISLDAYKLDTIIAHGIGSGQLYHQAVQPTQPNKPTSSMYRSVFIRDFTNLSGGSITVNEVGIYGTWSAYYFLVARDLISPSITILNKATMSITYRMETSI